MCKEFPGPRCSNHASLKKDKAWKSLLSTQQEYPADSLEMKRAQRTYDEAVEEYKATPDGLAMLPADIKSQYQKIRDFQIEALNEIRNHRFELISQLLYAQQSFYDKHEISSVLESVRKEEERKALQEEGTATTPQERKNDYLLFLAQQEQMLERTGFQSQETKELLSQLRSISAPKEQVTLSTYSNAKNFFPLSRENLRREIQRIAILQDVSTKVAEAYHDAYRNEYLHKYAHLSKKEQPNPPKEWVEGEFSSTGFQNDSTSKYIPTDAATMYATYRLRSDRSAIPDYLKQSRIVASAQVDSSAQQVNISLYNNKGKPVAYETHPLSTPHEAASRLRGRIIVMDNNADSRNWLLQLNKQLPLGSSVISLSDLGTKHLNVPDSQLKTFCQSVNVPYLSDRKNATSVLESYFKARNLITAKWQSKAPRRNAAALEDLPITSRWA